MSSDFLLSLRIGLLVMCAVYIGLRRGFGSRDPTIRRAVAAFSAVAGIMVTLFLREHPDLLEQQGTTIVLALGLGVTMLSDLPSLRLFGRLAAVCLAASVVGQLIILPASIALYRRTFG